MALNRNALIACFTICGILVGGWLYSQHVKVEKERASLRDELLTIRSISQKIDKNSAEVSSNIDTIESSRVEASNAGQARHDLYQKDSWLNTDALKLANKESSAVDKIFNKIDDLKNGMDKFADLASDIVGEDAVHQYRSDEANFIADMKMSYSNWSRAADDVVDVITASINNKFRSGSEIENLYQQSTNSSAKAESEIGLLANDTKQIRKRIEARANEINQKLKNT